MTLIINGINKESNLRINEGQYVDEAKMKPEYIGKIQYEAAYTFDVIIFEINDKNTNFMMSIKDARILNGWLNAVLQEY